MQTRFLQTLSMIADVGSFAIAADRLNMTLSTLSMQMKSLERDLNVTLFDRSFRPPKLTPIGRQIANQARHVIQSNDALVALCSSDGSLRGRFQIGFVMTASVRLLPGFLSNCRTLAPDAQFQVETGLSDDLQERVAHGQLDAAVITRADIDHVTLNYTRLATEEIVYAVPAEFEAEPINACMEQIPFLRFMPNAGIGKLISNHLAAAGYVPKTQIILDNVEAIVECVNISIGFTALPRPDVERYAIDDLVLRTMAQPPMVRELSLITLKDSAADHQVSRLKELF